MLLGNLRISTVKFVILYAIAIFVRLKQSSHSGIRHFATMASANRWAPFRAQGHSIANTTTGHPIQLAQKDAAEYVFKLRDEFYKIELFKEGILKGCKKEVTKKRKKEKGDEKEKQEEWWMKWENESGEKITLEEYLGVKVTKKVVTKAVEDKNLPPKLRLGLLAAWNEGIEKGISEDLVADLLKDVSTLKVDKTSKLQRSDSFTFGGSKAVPNPKDLLAKMSDKVLVKFASSKESKSFRCTDSIVLAAMYIRAYGDESNAKYREAESKFVFNLGGTCGIYRDTTGNGDLFYLPLRKTEEGVYVQQGGTTDHTWDNLATELSKHVKTKKAGKRLAQVLLNEYDGSLSLSEVIAIGAMLADAKYSIQGFLYAVEKLKDYKVNTKEMSELFAITGNPLWKYSLNTGNILNSKMDPKEKGRMAGLGFKELDLQEQKESPKLEISAPEKKLEKLDKLEILAPEKKLEKVDRLEMLAPEKKKEKVKKVEKLVPKNTEERKREAEIPVLNFSNKKHREDKSLIKEKKLDN